MKVDDHHRIVPEPHSEAYQWCLAASTHFVQAFNGALVRVTKREALAFLGRFPDETAVRKVTIIVDGPNKRVQRGPSMSVYLFRREEGAPAVVDGNA